MSTESTESKEHFPDELLREELAEKIWLSVSTGPRLIPGTENNPQQIKALIMQSLERLFSLEETAIVPSGERTKRLRSDTDVVVILSGAGKYSQEFNPGVEKPVDPAIYGEIPWMRRIDRARIRTGVLAMLTITAQRAAKEIRDLTEDDIKTHGPFLHYSATEWENDQFRRVLNHYRSLEISIPDEKIISYSKILVGTDEERPIKNTFDQFNGLEIPPESRRLLLVAHGPHLLRSMHILNLFPERVGETKVQAYPLASPIGSLSDIRDSEGVIQPQVTYAEMEIRGIIANYISGKGSDEPFQFEV